MNRDYNFEAKQAETDEPRGENVVDVYIRAIDAVAHRVEKLTRELNYLTNTLIGQQPEKVSAANEPPHVPIGPSLAARLVNLEYAVADLERTQRRFSLDGSSGEGAAIAGIQAGHSFIGRSR